MNEFYLTSGPINNRIDFSSDGDPSGRVGTVVGWGRTSEEGVVSAIVQEVQVPILSLQQCRQMKYRPQRITPNMVCAGRGTQDSCQVPSTKGNIKLKVAI